MLHAFNISSKTLSSIKETLYNKHTERIGQLWIEREIDSRLIKFFDERDFMPMKTYIRIFLSFFFSLNV